MTDSMKFGPEWLRNMSAESTNFGTSSHNNSSSNLSISGSGNGSHQISSNTSHMPAPRNMFPEFRYGREEMLSLFDKNCVMPQILPSFKKIFVEKVQYPLALTPSTDEETITQGPVMPTQRPTWIQRSPVGFNNSSRGTGRGGSVDRGRMRGKSVYHPIYQRPTAMFEEDLRTASLKTERGWSERNGAGDALASGGGPGSGGIGTDWNGTPASSPRKEFSSHPRNMENWRRNRNEDGSGDAPSSGIGTTEGWRGPTTTSFGSTHRWGRSTSWRDEDIPPGTEGGSGIAMQRSYSTITTVTERGGYVGNNNSKNSQNSANYSVGNQSSGRALNSISSGNALSRNNQWSSNSINTGGSGGVDREDNIPEWANENPSDSGGTFDASGAFHGSVDDDDSTDGNKEKRNLTKRSSSESSTQCNENKSKIEDNYLLDKVNSIAHESEVDEPAVSSSIECGDDLKQRQHLFNSNNASIPDNISQTDTQTSEELLDPNLVKDICSSESNSVLNPSTITTTVSPVSNSNYFHADDAAIVHLVKSSQESHSDFSDRMDEVADYMVEKLIMDDDTVGINDNNQDAKPNTTSPATNAMCIQNNFVSPAVAVMIKQRSQHPTGQSNVPVSPTIAGSHQAMPLYASGIVDHSTMQQHNMQQQQQQLATAAAASTATGLPHTMNSTPTSNEFWLYRDPQSKVQGPFTAIEMTEWYRAGYFNENLFVRRLCDTRFRALGDLIKLCHGNMPFTHSHLIPMGLESIHVPNAPAIPTAKLQIITDFGLKQQDEQHEELKGSVTAAADSLTSAVKNVNSPVDVSHIVNVQFRILQEQYIRHQEMLIVTELSKNECFQHLTPSEREGLVRQKVQMLILPEYLTSLTGLSNSLATLNPAAGNQLYDAIAECSKKDHLFAGGAQHQQQAPAANAYMDSDDYILNTQHPQQHLQTQFSRGPVPYGAVLGPNNESNSAGKMVRGGEDISSNELLNDFSLQMLLRSGNPNSQHAPQKQQQKSQDFMGNASSADFLTEPPLLAAAANPAQSPMMQMWMLGAATTNSAQSPQQTQAQAQPQNNQWPGNMLVSMPVTVMPVAPKSMGITMWNVPPLEQGQQAQQLLEHNVMSFDEKNTQNLSQILQAKEQKQRRRNAENLEEQQSQTPSQTQQQINMNNASQSSAPTTKQRKDESTEKQNSNKRNGKSQPALAIKTKDDNENNNRRNEEEHRRETTEEKRRLKEEKKRLQLEEEKRRLQQVEEQKRRQILEEKERQQQIQALRRKALSSNSSTALMTPTNNGHTLPSPGAKQGKEQRVQSSVAPWSAQTIAAAGKTGPCLAEIQKAERKERRADQQRQTEMLEKQMRSNAAATEANDATLKWNPSPIPVKSFAEIQAEEAKRLANEHLEVQRRKEHEQQVAQVVSNLSTSTPGVGTATSNISAIWSGTKAWGPISTSGFWEEPIKFGSTTGSCNTTAALIVSSGVSNNNSGKQPQSMQQKSTSSVQQASNVSRNLRKSQTVSVMQNTSPAIIAVKNSKVNNQQQGSTTAVKQSNRSQHLKTEADKIKGNVKTQNNNATSVNNAASNKKDDFENEFTGWCTKSLNNMNTTVDVPTFVTFLQDLESPYEVKDYVRMYLGESKEYTEFAKQFLERRSKYKNLQRAQNAHNDDMCKPAPAITPSGNDNSDSKGKPKKVKKSKMTRLDARILGFSVTAAEGRINVGDRDYVDAP